MAIAVTVNVPSKEAYEAVNEQLFGSKRPGVVEGGIIHTAGEGPNGYRIIDVWETREAFETFLNDRVGPALQELGMAMEGPQPEIVEVDYLVMNEEARV